MIRRNWAFLKLVTFSTKEVIYKKRILLNEIFSIWNINYALNGLQGFGTLTFLFKKNYLNKLLSMGKQISNRLFKLKPSKQGLRIKCNRSYYCLYNSTCNNKNSTQNEKQPFGSMFKNTEPKKLEHHSVWHLTNDLICRFSQCQGSSTHIPTNILLL